MPLVALVSPARAADPQLLGTYRDWNAFILEEPKGRACWMVSRPKRQEGDFTKRGDVYVLVSHRPYRQEQDVVSVVAGYAYAENTEVSVKIGGESFSLFTDGDWAWARETSVDRALSRAIRQGTIMVVRGTSSRGTRTTDTYSLSGSSAAYAAINKACGLAGS